MISVQVSYTVKPEFVEQNKQNISLFLADFKQMSHYHFLYQVYLLEDGVTFQHLSMYEDKAVQDEVLQVPSFLTFQSQRDASGLVKQPVIEKLSLIGSSIRLIS